MIHRIMLILCMIFAGADAWPQTPVDVPQWVELDAPPPPAYSKENVIPIAMPPYVTLKIGVDPESVAVGADGVVRYVVVMRNRSGSVNVAYEGILCTSGEVKTYARVNAADSWITLESAKWQPMTDNLPSRHAYAIAQQGACDGRTAAKRDDIVRALRRARRAFD